MWHPNCRCTTTPYVAEEEIEQAINELESYNRMSDEELYNAIMGKVKSGEYELPTGYKIINSGAVYGALNDENDPTGERRERHAIRYYRSVRNRNKKNEITKVSGNTEFSKKEVEKIYDHIFINSHLFIDGSIKRFDPSYDMSQSWQRLFQGNDIQKHDIIMLKHELMESEIMKDKTMPYESAHEETDKVYNYSKVLDRWKKENEHNSRKN